MRINVLRLQDFRSYRDQSFVFDEDKVFIFGPNGRGKTNILEALSLLSVGKSWRETKTTDLIKDDEVSAKILAQSREDNLEVLIQARSRIFKSQDKRILTKQWIGKIPSLLFCPELIYLFSGPKKDRLAFLDRFIVQVDSSFRSALLQGVKAHKQKTTLLKDLEHASHKDWVAQIEPWNVLLSKQVPLIWAKRKAVLSTLKDPLEHFYQSIAGTRESVDLAFLPSQDFEWDEASCLAWLHQQQPRERQSRRNSLSPLRDDVGVYLREALVAQSASRGEARSMMLALLSAQKEVLIKNYDITPILLLDDVFSELDTSRQAHLEALCEGAQTFFTTTHEEHIEGFSGKVQKIEL